MKKLWVVETDFQGNTLTSGPISLRIMSLCLIRMFGEEKNKLNVKVNLAGRKKMTLQARLFLLEHSFRPNNMLFPIESNSVRTCWTWNHLQGLNHFGAQKLGIFPFWEFLRKRHGSGPVLWQPRSTFSQQKSLACCSMRM